MGILYCIYKRDFSRKYSANLYKGSVYKIWSTSKDYIKQRHEIYYNILKSFYSRTGNLSSNIDSILPINRYINREVKLDIRTVL